VDHIARTVKTKNPSGHGLVQDTSRFQQTKVAGLSDGSKAGAAVEGNVVVNFAVYNWDYRGNIKDWLL
jgi:hypothetical protein